MHNIDNWTISHVWQGSILASIAHAIMVSFYPELAHEHSWEGMNYSLQDSQGGRGTISFQEDICFGAFNCSTEAYVDNLNEYFADVPNNIIELAQNEALQYLLQNIDGTVMPRITTAFWGTDKEVSTVDSIEDFYRKGGYLLKNIVADFESAVKTWEEYYEMNDEQLDLLIMLYNRKIAEPRKKLIISKQEIAMIGATEDDALYESETSFGEIGIYFRK